MTASISSTFVNFSRSFFDPLSFALCRSAWSILSHRSRVTTLPSLRPFCKASGGAKSNCLGGDEGEKWSDKTMSDRA